MRASRSWVQSILIVLGCVVLFVPGPITNVFGDGVSNWEPSSAAPHFSSTDWLSGDFQKAADAWFRERFGLRFLFLRTDNQLKWSLFSSMRGDGIQKVVIGRDGHLIQWEFVEQYCGFAEPVGVDVLSALARDLRVLQDALAARGVALMLVISPNKVAVVPETMPDEGCAPQPDHGFEYATMMSLVRELGVHHVDSFEAARRGVALHPDADLFPIGASHWNRLGAYYGAEAILLEMDEHLELDAPRIRLDGHRVHRNPDQDDVDLALMLNLLFVPDDFPTADPEISTTRKSERPLRMVVFGSSYMMLPLEIISTTKSFDQIDFYFYFSAMIVDYVKGDYHTARTGPVDTNAIDWQGDIFQSDVLILEINMGALRAPHIEPFMTAIFEQLNLEREG